MSEFLNSLNAPESADKTWAAEVAAAEATEAPAAAPEPVAAEPTPEPAAVQETAPEPAQAQDAAPEEHDRRVPLKALQEERQKRAEYERKLAEYERRMAEMEQRTRAPEPEAEPDPDPETDPIGALKAAKAQLQRMAEETQRQQYEEQLNNIAYNSAVQYQQQAPDYQSAYNYAIQSRAQELRIFGVAESDIPQVLKREEMNLIDSTVRAGRNPAEAIYQFAKARGYNPAPAPAPVPKPVAPDPALQQAKQAVAASAAAGGAPASKGELTDAEFVNLKGAAFDAAWNKKFGGNRNSLFRE